MSLTDQPAAPQLLGSLRILDLSQLLPGPLLTEWLAELGAHVTKIEPPQGDGAKLLAPELYTQLNGKKDTRTLDLRKSADDRAAFAQLAGQSDVLVEQFRPGTLARLGIDLAELRAAHPKLVVVSITGFGQTGPAAHLAGHDLNYRALSGELHQTGVVDGAPAAGNFQTADIAGGSLTAGVGLLAAVINARATGRGAHLDISMTDAIFACQAMTRARQRQTGSAAPRGTDVLSGGLPNYSVYETADGQHVALGALEPKFWLAFCAAVEAPELAKMPLALGQGGAATRARLTELFATRTRDEWAELGQRADCCLSPVLTPDEAQASELLTARGVAGQDAAGKPTAAVPIRTVDAESA